jgi:hypothetical protein
MEFDLAEPTSREQHEHAADGFLYYRLIEDLISEFSSRGDELHIALLEKLSKKYGLRRVRDMTFQKVSTVK